MVSSPTRRFSAEPPAKPVSEHITSGSKGQYRRSPYRRYGFDDQPALTFTSAQPQEDDLNETEGNESPDKLDHPFLIGTPSSDVAATDICLCQPEQKIRRPRNAFMLFRQHFKGSIAQSNPGVSVPEISKILGQRWNELPEDAKASWKNLARVEAERHKAQHPGYKYQPKRNSRRESAIDFTNFDPSVAPRCPKCGRQSMISPITPTSISETSRPGLPSLTPSTAKSSDDTPEKSRDSPFTAPTTSSVSSDDIKHPVSQQHPIETSMINMPLPEPRFAGSTNVPGSAGLKRRRDTNSGGYVPVSATAPHPSSSTLHPSISSFPGSYSVPPVSLPILQAPDQPRVRFARSHQDMMSPISPATGRLPSSPLRHSASSPGLESPYPPQSLTRHPLVLPPIRSEQPCSTEAVVMSMPPLPKIKVLGRISPPLKASPPSSPVHARRGFLIAVEGDDASAVEEMTRWLEQVLRNDGWGHRRHIRAFPGPRLPPVGRHAVLTDYFEVIQQWHVFSREIAEYLTAGTQSAPEQRISIGAMMMDNDEKPAVDKRSVQPVMIIPGYQLAASNAWASKIEIRDQYGPADQWQWMATLWRGIVGPDLTIYVRDSIDLHSSRTVEVPEDSRCILVRRERGRAFEEKTLRRLEFEMAEWMKDNER